MNTTLQSPYWKNPSEYAQKLIAEGCFDYVVFDKGRNSNIFFYKTRKEAREGLRALAKIQKGGVKIYSSKNKDINKEKDCIFIQLGEKHLVGSSTDQESFDYIQNIANRTPWVRIYTEIEK